MDNGKYLRHYGILGMRWGRRRSSSTVTTTQSRNSEDHDKKVSLTKKKINEMTNDELRTFTQRMSLEKQYKELSKVEIGKGQKFVNKLIDGAAKGATDMAVSIVNKKAAKLVEDMMTKVAKELT